MKNKLKLVLYFLSGLLLSWAGLIIGLILGLRTKDQKQMKLVLLSVGFLINIIVFPRFLYPSLTQKSETFIYDKFPELSTINEALKRKYPTREFGLGIEWNETKTLAGDQAGTTVKTKTISISYETDKSANQSISNEERKNIVQTACEILNDENVIIKINQNKSTMFLGIIPFNSYYSVNGTCKELLSNEDSGTNQQ